MKSVEDVVACVIDFGTFLSVAEKLAETYKTVFYHSPYETEYQDIRNTIKGTGLENVIRLDEFFDQDVFDSIDLFVFPDIGFGGLQRHLRSLGKAVWGHMGADALELYRQNFIDVLETVALPVAPTKKITGVTALAAYLKQPKNEGKWVKIDRFRGNMETWHHQKWSSTERKINGLAVIFGGAKETVKFVVQDEIESEMETGSDTWCIDGEFPPFAFQGYEKKNELYLASVVSKRDLPDEIKIVNMAMAPILKGYGYRCSWATEIRVADGLPYFIDPTPRMPGQSGEHQLETLKNFAEIIWAGANGEIITPKFNWKFAAEATLHYTLEEKDPAITNEWKSLEIPEEARRWVKLYNYCMIDNVHHFPLEGTEEVGVVLGGGDSTEEAIDDLNEHLKMLKGLPVEAHVAGFADLLKSIKEAEKEGIDFGDDVPEPETIFRDMDIDT